MENIPLVQIEGLSVRNGKTTLLKGINATLYQGERVAILGESGAGKSLLASAIMQLVPPSLHVEGKLFWKGLPLAENIKNLRGKSIAYIPQDPLEACFPAYTLQRQWTDFSRAIGTRFNIEETCRLLQQTGIEHPAQILQSFPHQLSGGQLQRVLIAMAVSGEPELLIADEPTTALDPVSQRQILMLIDHFCKSRQITLLYITHDLFIVPSICSRVMVLQEGRVVEMSSASDLLQSSGKGYGATFVRSFRKLLETPSGNKQQPNDPPLLEAQNLSVRFQLSRFFWEKKSPVQALKQVSLQLRKGQVTGVAGLSGSGKTTLLRSLAGLLPSNFGDIIFKGTRLNRLSDEEFARYRKAVQVIYQSPGSSLNPRQTAGQVLADALQLNGNETKPGLNDLLDWVKLPARVLSSYASQLSGGERQRVCIARGLALSPEILLCDEPTSSLDPSIQVEILDLFLSLKKELNLGILLVSHNLVAIRHTCDTVAIMAEGEIKEIGPAEKVFSSPTTNHTLQLIEAEPALTHNFL